MINPKTHPEWLPPERPASKDTKKDFADQQEIVGFDEQTMLTKFSEGEKVAKEAIQQKYKLPSFVPPRLDMPPEEQRDKTDELAINISLLILAKLPDTPQMSWEVFLRLLQPEKIEDPNLKLTVASLQDINAGKGGEIWEPVRKALPGFFTGIIQTAAYAKEHGKEPGFLDGLVTKAEQATENPLQLVKDTARSTIETVSDLATSAAKYTKENPKIVGTAVLAVGAMFLVKNLFESDESATPANDQKKRSGFFGSWGFGAFGAVLLAQLLPKETGSWLKGLAEKGFGGIKGEVEKKVQGFFDGLQTKVLERLVGVLPEPFQSMARSRLDKKEDQQPGQETKPEAENNSVVGGILSDARNRLYAYLPVLASVPLLGTLFEESILPSAEALEKFAKEQKIPLIGAGAAGAGLLTLYFKNNIGSISGKILTKLAASPMLALRLATSPVGLVAVLVGVFTLYGVDKAVAEDAVKKESQNGDLWSRIMGFFAGAPAVEQAEKTGAPAPEQTDEEKVGKFKQWWEGKNGNDGARARWADALRGDGKSETRNKIANFLDSWQFEDAEITSLYVGGTVSALLVFRLLLKGKITGAIGAGVPLLVIGYFLGNAILKSEDMPEDQKAAIDKEISPAESAEVQQCFEEEKANYLRQLEKDGAISSVDLPLPEFIRQQLENVKLKEFWEKCVAEAEAKNPGMVEKLLTGGGKLIGSALIVWAIATLFRNLLRPRDYMAWARMMMIGVGGTVIHQGPDWVRNFTKSTGRYLEDKIPELNVSLNGFEKLIPDYESVRQGAALIGYDLPNMFVEGEKVAELRQNLDLLQTNMGDVGQSGEDLSDTLQKMRAMIASQNSGNKAPVYLSVFHFARLALVAAENKKPVSVKDGENGTYTLEIAGARFEGLPQNPLAGMQAEFPLEQFETSRDIDQRMKDSLLWGLNNIHNNIYKFTTDDRKNFEARKPIETAFAAVIEKVENGTYADFTEADLTSLQAACAKAGYTLATEKGGVALTLQIPDTDRQDDLFAGIAPGLGPKAFLEQEKYLHDHWGYAVLSGYAEGWGNIIGNTMRDLEKHVTPGTPLYEVIRDLKAAPDNINDGLFLARFLLALARSNATDAGELDILGILETDTLTIAYLGKNIVIEVAADVVNAAKEIFLKESGDFESALQEGVLPATIAVGATAAGIDKFWRWTGALPKTRKVITGFPRAVLFDVPAAPLKMAGRSLRVVQNPLLWAELKLTNTPARALGALQRPTMIRAEQRIIDQFTRLEREISYWEYEKSTQVQGTTQAREKSVLFSKAKVQRLKQQQEELAQALDDRGFKVPKGQVFQGQAIPGHTTMTHKDFLSLIADKDPMVQKLRSHPPRQALRLAGTNYLRAVRTTPLKTVLNTLPSVFSAGAAGLSLYESFHEQNPEIKKLKQQQAGVQISIVGTELASWGAAAMWGGRALKIATPVGWVLLTADVLAQAGFESAEEAKQKFEDVLSDLKSEEITESALLDKISQIDGLTFGDHVRAAFRTVVEAEFDGDAYRQIRNEKPGMRRLRFQALLSFRLSQKNLESSLLQRQYYRDSFVRWQMAFIERQSPDFAIADFAEARRLAHESELFALRFAQVLETKRTETNLTDDKLPELEKNLLPEMLQIGKAEVEKLLQEEAAIRPPTESLTSPMHAAVYEAAKYYSYTGKPDLDSLKQFFSEQNRSSHRIYWNPRQNEWYEFLTPVASEDLPLREEDLSRLVIDKKYMGLVSAMRKGAEDFKAAQFQKAA